MRSTNPNSNIAVGMAMRSVAAWASDSASASSAKVCPSLPRAVWLERTVTAVDYAAEARHLTEGVRDRWEGLRSALVGAGFDLATGALVEVRTTGDLSEQAVFVDVDRRCYTIQLTFAPDDPSAVTVGVVSEFPIVPALSVKVL